MDGKTLLAYNWEAMLPEFIILVTILILALADLFMPRNVTRSNFGYIGAAGILFSFIALFSLYPDPTISFLFDTFYLDAFAKAFKTVLLVGGFLVLLMARASAEKGGIEENRGEYYYLFLTSLLGGMIAVSSADLITLFVGLELLSISSYILVAFRKKDGQSSEAGMKYVILSATSTGITLFGYSYLYGLTGTTNLKDMGDILFNHAVGGDLYILLFTLILVFGGLSFKLATVPFHMWVPDVYQGAPTSVAAFLSVVSKTAGFALFLRIMYTVFARVNVSENLLISFQSFFIGIAIVTILIGNIAALRQMNVKRLLAYSSIAHAGYILAGFAVLTEDSLDAVWFYLLVYTFMNIGAFAIIGFLFEREKDARLRTLTGLYLRSPLLAISLSLFLLSLAGIPGTAGFMAKIKIIIAALSAPEPHYLVASFIAIGTIISYYYYFGLMAQLFFRNPDMEEKLTPSIPQTALLTLCIVGTIWFGLFPDSVTDIFTGLAQGAGLWP